MTSLLQPRKLLLFAILIWAGTSLRATHYYVDSSATAGANNGLSWANAFRQLQPALNFANAGDTIWVARGHYYPGPSGSNLSYFEPKNGEVILGGFSGLTGIQETSASQRNFNVHRTYLSGDLDQSGSNTAADAWHVVWLVFHDTTAVLDGLTIEYGNAIGPALHTLGGGILAYNGAINIRNCIIEHNNSVEYGAGAYAIGHTLAENCIFRNNTAGTVGAALSQSNGTHVLRLTNCTFLDNSANNQGGAVFVESNTGKIYNCTFTRNTCLAFGAAIMSSSNSLEVRNCILWGNPGPDISGAAPTVRTCIVEGGFGPGVNIMTFDPQFLDAAGRIGACSPAVDVGDSLLSVNRDLPGNARPFDGDGNGVAKWDLGAYEASTPRSFPAANPILGPSPACANSFSNLYRVTNDLSASNNYLWSLSGGGSISGTNANDSVRVNWGGTLGTYTVTVVETNRANGCSTTNNFAVSLNAPPSVSVTPSPRDSICTGNTRLITGNGTAVARQWYLNGSPISGATGTTLTASVAGNYNVVMTGANGCADSAATGLKLYLRPLPVVTFSTSIPVPICQGQSVTITGLPAGSAYQWYRNGAALSGATAQTHTTGLAGRYNLRLTDVHGCIDSAATGLTVGVNPLPVVTVTPHDTDTICIGDSLAITATASNAVSYQWFRNGALIPGATANPIQAQLTGFYNCRLTNNNGCTDSAGLGHRLISNDFVNPVALCQNATVFLNTSGTATLTPALLDAGSTDNCRIVSRALSSSNMTCANLGTNAITLTVTDPAGRTGTCTSTVTVVDTLDPTTVCSPATVYLGSNGQLTLNPNVVGGASSDNCSISTRTVTPNFFQCADTGSVSVTFTAQDASGNTSACTTAITIEDSTRPIAICRTATVFLNGSGNASITTASVNNGSSDNCGIASLGVSRTSFTCADVPGAFVTLSVRDISGNLATCQAYVRVVDSVAPVAHCRDTTIYINFSGVANLTPANLNNGSSDNCGIDSIWIGQMAFTCADTGANFITLSVTDADTNLATCISIVTILDTIAPQAICSDTTFYLNASGIATVNPSIFGINSFDNCTFFDTSYVSTPTFNCAQTGPHSVELFVVDVNGRIDSCTGIVTVLDTLRPIAVCANPSPILGPSGTVSITVGMVNNGSTDNCSIATTALSQSSFTCANVGPNNVTLTVTDVFGNVGTCVSVVTVTDTVAPVANCQNQTVYLNGSGTAAVTAAQVNNNSSDNCAIASLSLSQTSFGCAQTGANGVTLTVTDTYGNARTCAATVTVLDTIRPVAICSTTTRYLNSSGSFSLLPAMIDNGSSDNCSISSYAISQNSFTCANIGNNSVTLTVTDPSGLTRSCTTTLIVLDTIDPTAVCNAYTVYLSAAGTGNMFVSHVGSGSTDNCSIAASGLSQSSFTCADVGVNAIVATFIDQSGNSSTCTASVTVADTVHPIATCQSATIYLNGSGSATLAVSAVDAGITDACGIQSRTLSQSSFVCGDLGANNVTLTGADSSGNTGSCVAVVTVLDTLRPVATCTTGTYYLDASGQFAAPGFALSAGSTDACTIDTAYTVPSTFGCNNIGSNAATVYVADPAGNLDSCTTTFTLLDNLAPVADCDSVLLQLHATGSANLSPGILGPNSYDNCGIDSASVSQTSFTCANTGWIAVTLTLRDSSGNQSSCVGHVLVVDTTGIAVPSVNLGADTTVCNGDTLTLSGGAGMSTYLWSTGASTPTIDVTLAGTYWVQVVSPQGCAGADTVSVLAFTSPNPNLRTESGNNVVCLNDTLRLLVNPVFSTYQWSTGSSTSFSDVTSGGNFGVIVTDANGCRQYETIDIDFAPFPGPNPVITPSGIVGMCENTTLPLDAGAGYYAYLWNTGQTAQTITAFIIGTYRVEVWNGFGCHATSADVQVINLPSPYPDINRNVDTLYTNTIGATYQWYIGGVPILGANNASYVATINGSYTVRVFYASGCDEISAPLSFTVGMSEAAAAIEGISLFPNPSDGLVSLQAQVPVRQALTLRVTDMYGRVVYSEQLRQLRNDHELDLRALPAGVYLLEMRGADHVTTRRLVIE